LKTEEVSTESDPTIPGVPSINEDIFEDEKSVKKVIDENPEETFKIDYDGLVDLAQRESISSNTSDDNLSWLLNYKITNV